MSSEVTKGLTSEHAMEWYTEAVKAEQETAMKHQEAVRAIDAAREEVEQAKEALMQALYTEGLNEYQTRDFTVKLRQAKRVSYDIERLPPEVRAIPNVIIEKREVNKKVLEAAITAGMISEELVAPAKDVKESKPYLDIKVTGGS